MKTVARQKLHRVFHTQTRIKTITIFRHSLTETEALDALAGGPGGVCGQGLAGPGGGSLGAAQRGHQQLLVPVAGVAEHRACEGSMFNSVLSCWNISTWHTNQTRHKIILVILFGVSRLG